MKNNKKNNKKIVNKSRDLIDYGLEVITLGGLKTRSYTVQSNGKTETHRAKNFTSFKKNVLDK